MKDVIRRKTEKEKWKKELICCKSYEDYRDVLWYCEDCKKLFEADDFAELWESEDETEMHCNLCKGKMTCAKEDYFRNIFLIK